MAVVHLWADVSAAVRLHGEFGYCAIHYVALWQFVIDFVKGLLCKVQIKVRLVFQNYAPCSKISGTSVIIEVIFVNSFYRRIIQCGL